MFSLIILPLVALGAAAGKHILAATGLTVFAKGQISEKEREQLEHANYLGMNPVLEAEEAERTTAEFKALYKMITGQQLGTHDLYYEVITRESFYALEARLRDEYPTEDLLPLKTFDFLLGEYCLTRTEMFILEEAIENRFLKRWHPELAIYKELSRRRLADPEVSKLVAELRNK